MESRSNISTARESIPCVDVISFSKDLANVFTLLGVLCSLLGIYFAMIKLYSATVIAMLWTFWFDWFDGFIARRTHNRTESHKRLGLYLDSIADIVNFGVCPAILLISYSNFNIWFLPAAFLLVATCLIRLSNFILSKRDGDGSFPGLSVDMIVIIIAPIMLFDGYLHQTTVSLLLLLSICISLCLNLSKLRMPKFTNAWYFSVTLFVLLFTYIYSSRLFSLT